MATLLIVHEGDRCIQELASKLGERGHSCCAVASVDDALSHLTQSLSGMLLVHMNGRDPGYSDLPREVKRIKRVPVLALVSREAMMRLDYGCGVDDFAVEPWDPDEIATRVRGLLWKTGGRRPGQVVRRGDLIIDQAGCEVSVAGRPVELTFREYELLKFLAVNHGRVFTRDMLLDKVWGLDYLGGDRTVDVHVRRLRHKLEDPTHTFLETVRNIGYRFVRQPGGAADPVPAQDGNGAEILPKQSRPTLSLKGGEPWILGIRPGY